MTYRLTDKTVCVVLMNRSRRMTRKVTRKRMRGNKAMVSVSYPQLPILVTHVADAEVAHNAMLGLGRLGAGTNNARLAPVLRQLAQYHAMDQNNLFMVRIAQGLVHLGKGTLTLNPFHSDRQLMSPVAVSWQFSSHSLMSRLPF